MTGLPPVYEATDAYIVPARSKMSVHVQNVPGGFFSGIVPGVIAYLVAWAVLPAPPKPGMEVIPPAPVAAAPQPYSHPSQPAPNVS